MKDKIEKFIIRNRDQFDTYDPDPAMWEKINKNLKRQKIRKINWKSVLLKAAAVVVIFISSYVFHEFMQNDEIKISERIKNITNKSVPEYVETEIYYTTMLNDKLEEVHTYLVDNPDLEMELNNDLSSLDSLYNDLKKDLNDNISNEEVIEAMIQNYRLKLRILEDLLEQLQNSDNLNTNENIQHLL